VLLCSMLGPGNFRATNPSTGMKLAFFDDYRLGVISGERIIDVQQAFSAEMLSLRAERRAIALAANFDSIKAALNRGAGAVLPLSSVRLRAPIPRPGKIVVAVANLSEGIAAPNRGITIGLKSPSAILDPFGTVELPARRASAFYPLAQLAVIIGREARNVAESRALDHVFGYTCAIDVVARGPGLVSGVACDSFDGFCPLGPWVVTRDEIADPQNLSIRSWQNDQARQQFKTSDMQHTVAQLIAWISRRATLDPGDVLLCGTDHQGLGPMQGGESSTVEIQGLGRLSVQVRDSLNRRWASEPDPRIAAAMRQFRLNGTPLNLQEAFAREIQ
jgi:2-keto-4-pentenoate hydratase/2-oxohepta-3-ene-1,7-dioic acid hydratase in catechol pathway